MTQRTILVLALVAAFTFISGCGDSGDSKAIDAAPTADAFESDCGVPGDLGNELGIGKFCASLSDCSGTANAPLCSSLGDPNTHFCTKTCQMNGPPDQCGTATECTCNGGGQCGCTPSVCLGP
ncbi:MAG: hypothetical protein KF773_03160 [Deltaproteobacteria bacterium]|nr:hypothetical protein [Deltaproteobacteria bacterium]